MKKARIRDWVRVLLMLFSVRKIVYSFGIVFISKHVLLPF